MIIGYICIYLLVGGVFSTVICDEDTVTASEFAGVTLFWPLFALKGLLYVTVGPIVLAVKHRDAVRRGLSKWWVIPKSIGLVFRDTGRLLVGK